MLGVLSVVTALGGAGFVVAHFYAQRPRQLRALQSALTMLLTEITFTATPLPDALERIARHSSDTVSRFASAVAKEIRAGQGVSTAEVWRRCVYAQRGKWSLTLADEDILLDLGEYLGRSYADDQQKHLQLAITQLARRQAEAETVASVQIRLWRYLGFCAAGLLLLLLY